MVWRGWMLAEDAPGTVRPWRSPRTVEDVQLAGFCRQFKKSSNSPFLAPSRNASNSGIV